MEYAEFKAQEGQGVVIADAAGEVQAVIASVDQLGDRAGRLRIPFSVILHAPTQPLLEQGIYPLTIDCQTLDLFLVPIGPEGDQMCYEIVFN